MRGATLFSGIGAPEIAAPEIEWVWHAEIDAFPSAVMAHHHGTPNLGDVSADDFIERAKQFGPIDILVAGSPCQSFSVAGKRLGLDDPRGNLALVTLRICQQLRPRWLVFENVPGLLTSGRGDDFAAFLDQMEECGYSGGWRVFDAQYAGVAQRRRRVFVVGHIGDDWRPPAAVLFEPASLCGDTPPSREAREETAPYSGGGIDDGRVVGTVTSKWAKGSGGPAGDEGYNLICFGANNSAGSHWDDASNPHPTLTRISGGIGSSNQEVFSQRGGGLAPDLTVRRLTPRECERLQGFPDDFTLIPYRHGKPAADGPRYKALGNSMAVPVIGWVLNRIQHFHKLRGLSMSLYKNMNARKKAGTSRSKADSTVSDKTYAKMKSKTGGFAPKKGKK